MTKEEKIKFATSLLMDAGVDFKIGNTSFVHEDQGDVAPEEGARGFDNPTLQQSAKQFNDTLLDEQAKKIVSLQSEVDRLHRWEKFTKEVSVGKEKKERSLKKKISRLAKEVKEKDDLVSLLTEELSRSKVHVSGLIDSVSKYQSELIDLRQKYADKVVDEINMNALKSAENALKEKDEVIDDLTEEIKHLYNMVHGDPILKMKERKKEEDVEEDEHDEDVPSEDNSEEIEIDEAVDRIRKALKEGKTVVVDHDDCADIINVNL